MIRTVAIIVLAMTGVLIVDQSSKALFLSGYYSQGECVDWVLHFNTGVAFSMLSFLGPYLKWLQALLIVLMAYVMYRWGVVRRYPFAVGLLMGGALGNLYDRFAHGAVVDFIAWHCGFRWPVFNVADVAIDVGVAILLWGMWQESKKDQKGAS